MADSCCAEGRVPQIASFLPCRAATHSIAALLSCLQSELGYPAEALEPLQVAEAISPLPRPALPPYNGYGTLDDSKQNCVALVPKPPKKVCAHLHAML
jgi:hypothetical protein